MLSASTQTAPHNLVFPFVDRNARTFYGNGIDDVHDWIEEYERVCRANFWADDLRLANASFFVDGPAHTCFENHDGELLSWGRFKSSLKQAFAPYHRQERAEALLPSRMQLPEETVTSYTEDVLRVIRRFDPSIPEHKKIKYLLRGVREDIFRSLARDLPKTAEAFPTEAVKIEKAVFSRDRPAFASLQASRREDEFLSDIIRQIVREELRKIL